MYTMTASARTPSATSWPIRRKNLILENWNKKSNVLNQRLSIISRMFLCTFFLQSSSLFPCENDILKINDYLEKNHFLLYFTSKQYLRLIYFLGFSRHLFLFFSFDYSHFILCICYRIKIDWSIYSHLKQLVLAMHIHVFDIDDFSIFLCDRVLFLKKLH